MSFKQITPIYRDENADILNELLESFLGELEMEQERIKDSIMDLTLDVKSQREKSTSEMMKNPKAFHEVISLTEMEGVYDKIVTSLRNIMYSGYKELLIKDKSSETQRKYIKKENIPKMLGEIVKPLILEGLVTQQEINSKTNIPTSNLSYWVKKAYGENWREYVEHIKDGTY